MTTTSSTMTWLEEWLVTFDTIFGTTTLRWGSREKLRSINQKLSQVAMEEEESAIDMPTKAGLASVCNRRGGQQPTQQRKLEKCSPKKQ